MVLHRDDVSAEITDLSTPHYSLLRSHVPGGCAIGLQALYWRSDPPPIPFSIHNSKFSIPKVLTVALRLQEHYEQILILLHLPNVYAHSSEYLQGQRR